MFIKYIVVVRAMISLILCYEELKLSGVVEEDKRYKVA